MVITTRLRIGNLKTEKITESTVRKRLKEAREKDCVTELSFYKVDFTIQILKDLQKLFCRDGRRFHTIKVFQCTGHVSEVVQMICDYSSTRTLVLSGSCLEQTTLSAVNDGLSTNQSICTLRILGGQFVTYQCLEGLIRNCTLRELDLTGSHLSPEAANSLANSFSENRSLEVVRLEGCGLEDEAMAEIIQSISSSNIADLDLSNNAADTRALEAIASLLLSEPSSSLRSLNLSSQQLLHVTEGKDEQRKQEERLRCSVTRAVSALSANTFLKTLDISNNHFLHETSVVDALVMSLSVNRSLGQLDVSDSQITEAGIRILAEHLPSFFSLKVLNLAGNDLNERTAKWLVKGLRGNRILESLGGMTEQGSHALMQHFLDLNMGGRRAMQNDIPLSVWPQLLARAAGRMEEHNSCQANVLYSLLRGPALSL